MSEEKSRLKMLIEAVEEERKVEEKYFRDISTSKSKAEKIESGHLIYPVQIVKQNYTLGEYVELQLEAPPSSDPRRSRIREGVGCLLIAEDKETKSFKGTVSKIRRKHIFILLRSDIIEKQSITYAARLGLEQVYDERPYKVMTKVIDQVLRSEENHIKEIRYCIERGTLFRFNDVYPGFHFDIPEYLNDSQKKAIKKCLQTPYVSVIHGPPGTGKTTTLVALIKCLLQAEKRILVSAPSNNASDLLAFLLDKAGVNVIRIGNVSRIGDKISHLTLDEKAREHKDWQNIKKVKVQAADVQKRAKSYKRSFDKKDYLKRKGQLAEAKELYKWARTMEKQLTDYLLEDSQVVVSTLIGIDNRHTSDMKFDTAIIDEASQSLEPECWNAVLRARRVILAGDHKQLSPTVKSKKAMEMELQLTLLDQLAPIKEISTTLDIQYRMHNHILSFSNQEFYEGLLNSHESVAARTLENDEKAFQLIDTIGTGYEENFNPDQRSYSNEGEFSIIAQHIHKNQEILNGISIGIISPYAEQVNLIKTSIEDHKDFEGLDVEVNSIDGFQGQEKDLIYISMVRSNNANNIGFLADTRRLNVAMTRARKKLVIIGDMVTLSSDPIYERLIAYAESINAYESAWDYMDY